MNIVLRSILPALLALAASEARPVAAADTVTAPKDCSQLKQYGSVAIIPQPDGDVWVPVLLNEKPGQMYLNTGAAMSTFWERTVRERFLRRGELRIRVGYSDAFRQVATFDSFALGTVQLGKGGFSISTPTRSFTGVGDSLGVVGTDVLSRVDFELDLAHRKLNLFSQDHCPGLGAYWASAWAAAPLYRGGLGELYFPMELEGKKVAATLSTGSEFTLLTTEVTRRLYGFDEKSPGVEVEASSGKGNDVHRYRAMQITAPGLTLKNTRIALVQALKDCTLVVGEGSDGIASYSENSCKGAYPMILGRDVLEKLRLYFSTKEQMLYFTAADATK